VGAISDTAGTLKLTATGSLDMTADSTVANATIVTTGGALRMGEGVTLDAGNGAITFTSSTSIVLGDIQGGVVSLTASSGGIQGDPTVSVPDVLATTSLSISATDDVGSASAMLRVKTPLITSATGTGGTYLAVTDAMSITSVTRSGALGAEAGCGTGLLGEILLIFCCIGCLPDAKADPDTIVHLFPAVCIYGNKLLRVNDRSRPLQAGG
jgi:hypothetical protein